MSDLPKSGLYRTTQAHPLAPDQIPSGRLVYVGKRGDDMFVVHPQQNVKNRWFWSEPTVPLTDASWGQTLKPLRAEGFYSLPETMDLDGGGRWIKNAIVQLGYDRTGAAILFIAERREGSEENSLFFSDRGVKIKDDLLARLTWAPILPVSADRDRTIH